MSGAEALLPRPPLAARTIRVADDLRRSSRSGRSTCGVSLLDALVVGVTTAPHQRRHCRRERRIAILRITISSCQRRFSQVGARAPVVPSLVAPHPATFLPSRDAPDSGTTTSRLCRRGPRSRRACSCASAHAGPRLASVRARKRRLFQAHARARPQRRRAAEAAQRRGRQRTAGAKLRRAR